MPPGKNDWLEHKLYIKKELERLGDNVEQIQSTVDKGFKHLDTELAKIKLRNGIQDGVRATLAGLAGGAITLAIEYFLR